MIDIQRTKKEQFRAFDVIPTPPGHTQSDHITQSLAAIIAAYLIMGLGALITAMVGGVIVVPHNLLVYIVVLAPIFAVFSKDFFHYLQGNGWTIS